MAVTRPRGPTVNIERRQKPLHPAHKSAQEAMLTDGTFSEEEEDPKPVTEPAPSSTPVSSTPPNNITAPTSQTNPANTTAGLAQAGGSAPIPTKA